MLVSPAGAIRTLADPDQAPGWHLVSGLRPRRSVHWTSGSVHL